MGRSRASKDREVEQRFASLTNSLGPDDDDQIDSSSSRRRPGGKKVQFDDDDVY